MISSMLNILTWIIIVVLLLLAAMIMKAYVSRPHQKTIKQIKFMCVNKYWIQLQLLLPNE